jgi:hypothetical protein
MFKREIYLKTHTFDLTAAAAARGLTAAVCKVS